MLKSSQIKLVASIPDAKESRVLCQKVYTRVNSGVVEYAATDGSAMLYVRDISAENEGFFSSTGAELIAGVKRPDNSAEKAFGDFGRVINRSINWLSASVTASDNFLFGTGNLSPKYMQLLARVEKVFPGGFKTSQGENSPTIYATKDVIFLVMPIRPPQRPAKDDFPMYL